MYEAGIRKTPLLEGRTDPGNPQAPEFPLALAPVTVSKGKSSVERFLGSPDEVSSPAVIALGKLVNPYSLSFSYYTTFYSHDPYTS